MRLYLIVIISFFMGYSVLSYAENPPAASTYADPTLKNDILPSISQFIAIITTRQTQNACKETLSWNNVVSTQIPPSSSPSSAWSETWNVKACNNVYTFLINFTPDAQQGGTTFAIKWLPGK